MEVEIRQLKMICAISQTGSLTKAAAALGLTQPALTYQLQRMERTFGGELFHRDRHGARPTALGELVIDRARALLPGLDELLAQAQLRIGSNSTLTSVRVAAHSTPLAAPILQRLREMMPGADVTMRHQRCGQDAIDLLAAGRVELAVLVEHPQLPLLRPPGVVVHEVVTAPMFVAMAATSPLAAEGSVRLSDLADQRWIVPEDLEIRCAEYLRGVCERSGFSPDIAYHIDGDMTFDVIGRGLGVTLVQATAVADESVSIVPVHGESPLMRHVVALRVGTSVFQHADQLIDFARRSYWERADRSEVYQRWLGAVSIPRGERDMLPGAELPDQRASESTASSTSSPSR
ncbi:MAG: LysR family transcriptional regulator [Kutzneria sp.]|nr:LysR family transcriptional regulator [Kutzneria sp.]